MMHPAFLATFSAGDAFALIAKTTIFGKLIMLILFVISVLSWAVMIEKARLLARIRRGHLEFWNRCDAWLSGRGAWADLERWCRQRRSLPLANLLVEAAGQQSPAGVRRAAERIAYAEVENMERYLMLLATAVTISPFLGLLGTVWGIMTAFWDMAAMKSANLLVVAPGIAEALITTIGGLAAAIPAVVFYNLSVRKIDLVTNEMERLRSLLEEQATSRQTEPGVPAAAESRRPDVHEKERIR
jgi:biopolymer transport protein TolQ